MSEYQRGVEAASATYKEVINEYAQENEALRELVRDMWLHSYCSISKTCEDDERHIERVIDRMQELGIEVRS